MLKPGTSKALWKGKETAEMEKLRWKRTVKLNGQC